MIEKEGEGDSFAFLDHSAAPVETAAHDWAGLSKKQREKGKQLIDQYGTEEGLRRLREMDPEAARRFEREHPPRPEGTRPREQGREAGLCLMGGNRNQDRRINRILRIKRLLSGLS